MFLFVAMIHLPGALAQPHDRFIRTIVFREMCFGGAGWVLAGIAMKGRPGRSTLIAVGGAFVTMALIVFGVEQFLLRGRQARVRREGGGGKGGEGGEQRLHGSRPGWPRMREASVRRGSPAIREFGIG